MKTFLVFSFVLVLAACGGDSQQQQPTEEASRPKLQESTESDNPSYDPHRGEGKFTTVDIGTGIDNQLADAGEKISGVKCASCHKTTEERLVGPGWKGVTTRRTAPWIMNFITNPNPMIDKDPELQSQLEICLVRMPDQNLSDDEARQILEYMRKNDGAK